MNRLEIHATRWGKNIIFVLFLLLIHSLLIKPSEAVEVKKVIKIPELYLVKKGDHLWKLSDKEYKDPYKWRFLWENNEYIDNPNLIFPGDRILIPGSFVDKDVVEITENKPAKKVKPGLLPIVSESLYAGSGYISNDEEKDGIIIDGLENRTIFGEGDTLYIDISGNNAKKGDMFTVLRELRSVRHPISNKMMGILVQEIGLVEVNSLGKDNSTVDVVMSYTSIEPGDYLRKKRDSNDSLYDTSSAGSDKEIEGHIIEGKELRSIYGRGDVVYIDAGRDDGVLPGDTFAAYNYGKRVKIGGISGHKKSLPVEIISKIMVFRVKDKTATAIVIEAKKETSRGAPIRYYKE